MNTKIRVLKKSTLSILTLALVANGILPVANAAPGQNSVGPAPRIAGTVIGGTLNVTARSDYSHLDPQRCYSTGCGNFGRLLWRTLTGYQNVNGKLKLVGDLASDIGTPSNGGKTWTFKLRPNLKWEDGKSVYCSQIEYGIKRSFDQLADAPVLTGGPAYSTVYIENKEKYQGPYATPDRKLSGVSCGYAGDVEKITINLNFPSGDFNQQTTFGAYAAVRLDKDTIGKYDNEVFSNGPYKIETRVFKDKTVLVRNPYWDAKTDPIRVAAPDKIDMLFGQDPVNTNNLYINDSGRATNGFANAPLAQNTALLYDAANDAITDKFKNRSYMGPSIVTDWIAINVQKVTDLNLRKAIQCAFNKETARAAIGGKSVGEYTNSLTPTMLAGYSKYTVCTDDPKGDVEKAKAFLAKATTKKTLTFVYSNATKDAENMALALKASLERAGIAINIKAIDSTTYYDILEKQGPDAPDLMLYGWAYDWPNASTIYPPLFDSTLVGDDLVGENKSRVKDAKLDALMKKAIGETNPATQAKLWIDIDKYVVNTIAAVVPFYQGKSLYWYGSNVGGQYYSPMAAMDWANVYLKNGK